MGDLKPNSAVIRFVGFVYSLLKGYQCKLKYLPQFIYDIILLIIDVHFAIKDHSLFNFILFNTSLNRIKLNKE